MNDLPDCISAETKTAYVDAERAGERLDPEFEAVCRGLSLAPDEASAIVRLLERKHAAEEKDRVVPEPALAPLLASCQDELTAFKWRRNGADTSARAAIESVFLSVVRNSPAGRFPT